MTLFKKLILEGLGCHSIMKVIATRSVKERQLEPIISQNDPRMHLVDYEMVVLPVPVIGSQEFRHREVVALAVAVHVFCVLKGSDQLDLMREPDGTFQGEIEEERGNDVEVRRDDG